METNKVQQIRTRSGGTATIVGVSHLSPESVALVTGTILKQKPDTVCIELDAPRAAALGIIPPDTLKTPGRTGDVIEAYPPAISKPVYPGILGFSFAAAASMSAMLYASMMPTTKYGSEQVEGVQAARRIGAKVHLIDRNIAVTLARLNHQVSWVDVWYMLPSIVSGVAFNPSYNPPSFLVAKCLYHCAARDFTGLAGTLREILDDATANDPIFSASLLGRRLHKLNWLLLQAVQSGKLSADEKKALPVAFEEAVGAIESVEKDAIPPALSRERDILLAEAILNAPGNSLVAVVGQGHMHGVLDHVRAQRVPDPAELQELLNAPRFHFAGTTLLPLGIGLAAIGSAVWMWKRKPAALAGSFAVLGLAGMVGWQVVRGITATHTRLRQAAQ